MYRPRIRALQNIESGKAEAPQLSRVFMQSESRSFPKKKQNLRMTRISRIRAYDSPVAVGSTITGEPPGFRNVLEIIRNRETHNLRNLLRSWFNQNPSPRSALPGTPSKHRHHHHYCKSEFWQGFIPPVPRKQQHLRCPHWLFFICQPLPYCIKTPFRSDKANQWPLMT